MRDVIAPLKSVQPAGIEPAGAQPAGAHPAGEAVPRSEPVGLSPFGLSPFQPAGIEAACIPPQTVKPLTPELHRIHFTASDAFVKKLERVKDAMARQVPDGNLEAIFEAGLELLLAQDAKRKGEVKRPRTSAKTCNTETERVPDAVKRDVWKRDTGRCQWRLAAGGICGETRFLEMDHINPLARGGRSTLENVRLLCSAHNARAAREVFGDAWMDRFRNKARLEPG